jgi:hypothetical protein
MQKCVRQQRQAAQWALSRNQNSEWKSSDDQSEQDGGEGEILSWNVEEGGSLLAIVLQKY